HLSRHRNDMTHRPVVDAAIHTLATIASREKTSDLAFNHFVAVVHLAIHDVHVAVAGGIARPKLHEEAMAGAIMARRNRHRCGTGTHLADHLGLGRQTLQGSGSQAHAEKQRETAPHDVLLGSYSHRRKKT